MRYVVVFLIESTKKVPSVVDDRMALSRKGIELLATGLGPKSLPSFVVELVDIQIQGVGLGLRVHDSPTPDVQFVLVDDRSMANASWWVQILYAFGCLFCRFGGDHFLPGLEVDCSLVGNVRLGAVD